jgi:hypothetical protein
LRRSTQTGKAISTPGSSILLPATLTCFSPATTPSRQQPAFTLHRFMACNHHTSKPEFSRPSTSVPTMKRPVTGCPTSHSRRSRPLESRNNTLIQPTCATVFKPTSVHPCRSDSLTSLFPKFNVTVPQSSDQKRREIPKRALSPKVGKVLPGLAHDEMKTYPKRLTETNQAN